MCRQIASMFRIAITFAVLIVPAIASGVYLPSRYFTRSSLMKGQDCRPLSRSRRTRQNWAFDNSSETRLVARKKRIQQEVDEAEEATFDRDLTYNDLGPIGKTVAGCTEVVITTVMDFCTGYIQGWLLGTIVGTPGFVFRPVEKGLRQPFSKELSGRFARMNTRNKNWSKTFGRISAAFGGFGVAVKVLRNGEQDIWTDIFSSAAAGAYFGRKEGIQGMLRGALLYGGIIYVTSSSKRNGQLQDYTEEPAAISTF